MYGRRRSTSEGQTRVEFCIQSTMGMHALETTYLVLPDSRWVIVYPHVQHVVLDQE